MTLNLITSVLGFALLGQTGHSLMLGQLNSSCDGTQICRLFEETNYSGDAWDICPDDIASGEPINLKDQLGFEGPTNSWKCFYSEYQYAFCAQNAKPQDPAVNPFAFSKCVSSGGAQLNPNDNPFGETKWVWVREHDQVPIGDGSGDMMPPLTTYSRDGCKGVENVFFEGVSNAMSDVHYLLKRHGIASARIPIGFHVEYFAHADFEVTDPDEVLVQQAQSPLGGPVALPGQSTTCQNAEAPPETGQVWYGQPKSFCYCKDCFFGDEQKFGPEFCYCPGCNDTPELCEKYPTSLPCDDCDINDPTLSTVELWLPCFCDTTDRQDFLDLCCDFPILDISQRAALPQCKPICDKFQFTPGCPAPEGDCTAYPFL